jgi:hypothetical protein
MTIEIGAGIQIGGGISVGAGLLAPAITFGTPAVMNAGAFTSLLQPNGTAINSSGLITSVGNNGGNFASAISANGTTWTGPALVVSGNTFMTRVTWSSYHNLFLAIGTGASSYPIYATSTDGVTWTSATVISATAVGNIWALTVNSAGVFAAIMQMAGGVPAYVTSADGSTWTTPTSIPGAASGVFYFNAAMTVNTSGNFVVTGYNSFDSAPWYAYSANGSTWAAAAMPGSGFTPRSIVWSSYHSLFVTIGGISGSLAYSTSTNGTTWTTPTAITGSTGAAQILSLVENPSGVIVGVGQLQVGATSEPVYLTSTNGVDWSVPTLLNGSTAVGYLRGVVWNTATSTFVAVGADGGANWIYSVSTAPGLTPALSLDAGNSASYPGTGTTWTDTVGSIPFTLVNGPTYNSADGGYLQFNPGSGQYGYSTTNLGTLANWSIEAWHYYDGTNTSAGPNIFTEWQYGGGTINLGLGCGGGSSTDLQAWWYGAGFHATPSYSLTPGAWYQIVGTFDGDALKLYVNNTLVQTQTGQGPGGAANPAIGYGLMTRWDPGGLWGGRLAILNVYNTDIGAGGVTTSWNANKARFGL